MVHGIHNDITLLKLNESINFESYNYSLNSVCLPDWDTSEHFHGVECYSAGWGRTSKDGDFSKFLKEVKFKLASSEKCNFDPLFMYNERTQLCGGGNKKGGEGECSGDSGGPLVCRNNGTWYQYGIVSYGRPCARPHIPDVFTRVSAFYDWIVQTIDEHAN